MSARAQLVAGTMLLLIARLALTIPRTGPLVVADEVGYLTNARVLAGGVSGQMSTAPFYHGGYSLLLAPLLAAAPSPETGYRLVLALNAVLAATLAPLLYLLLTRCFAVRPAAAVWPALAAAAYPSVTIFTQVAMSENLLLPLAVLWLLCLGCFLQTRDGLRGAAWASAAAAASVLLWAAHGRMIVAVALTAAVLLAAALHRRAAARAALLGLVLIGVGLVGVHVLDSFLVSRNYGGHAHSEVGGRLSTLESAGGIGAALRNVVGQTWYLVVAPLGVFVAAGLPRLSRYRHVARITPADAVLAVAVLTGIGLLLESALSFPTVDRPDMIVYGRYTEIVVPPLLALALARLAARPRFALRRVLLVVAVTTAAAALVRVLVHPPGTANRWNVASLPSPTFGLGAAVLVAAGVAAAVAAVLLALTHRRAPAALAPLAIVLFLPTTAVAEHRPVLSTQSFFYPSGWTSPAPAVGGARTVAFDTDHGGGLYVDQWFVSNAKFVLFAGSTQRPPARIVISSPGWAAAHRLLHPVALWTDAGRRERRLFRIRDRRR